MVTDARNYSIHLDAGGSNFARWLVLESCFLVGVQFSLGLGAQQKFYVYTGDINGPPSPSQYTPQNVFLIVEGSAALDSVHGFFPCRIPLRYSQPVLIWNEASVDVCSCTLSIEPLDQ